MTTGAANDIEKATELARKMVCEFGMSSLGPITYGKKEEQIFLGREIAQHQDYSEDTAIKVLSRAVGSTILSASTSVQEALEGYQGHGLFTYVLADGLKGKADKGRSGFVRTTELADYVDNEVPQLAEQVFQRAQYPTISISGQAFPIGQVQ